MALFIPYCIGSNNNKHRIVKVTRTIFAGPFDFVAIGNREVLLTKSQMSNIQSKGATILTAKIAPFQNIMPWNIP